MPKKKSIAEHLLTGTYRHDRHNARRLREEAAAKHLAENPPEVLEELKAWAMAFTSSWDFFGDLVPYGLADDKAVRRAARAAWKRLGARFMASWKPTPVRAQPWALERFGKP
jgi:hypothetical protein